MQFIKSIFNSMRGYKLFGFGGFNGYAPYEQTRLIEEGYATNADLYAIIKRTAETGANIPIVLEYLNENGNWEKMEEETSDPVEQRLIALLKRPNSEQDFITYFEQAIAYLLMTGESFTKGDKIAGTDLFSSFYAIPSNYVEVNNKDKSFPVTPESYTICSPDNLTKGEDVEKKNMLFVKYHNPTEQGVYTARGMSPLQAGYLTLMASNEVNVANAEILKNKGAAGILSNESGKPLKDEERNVLQKMLDGMLGGSEKAGKIISSPVKMSYLQLGMSAVDLQIIESGTIKLRQLANLYGADSSLFNDPANKTYSNRTEASKDFYNGAVLPPVNRIIQGLNYWLLKPFSEDTGRMYRLKADTSKIEVLQKDQKAEAEKNKVVSESISSLSTLVSQGQLDSVSAINTLVYAHGMSFEQAQELIPSGPINQMNNEE